MTHGRTRRKPRRISANPMHTALMRATRLTDQEVTDLMRPARECAARLREGVATEDQYIHLYTAFRIANEIENNGIVRGLREHIHSALIAMDAIETRARASGTWKQTALHYYELDAINSAVDLHE